MDDDMHEKRAVAQERLRLQTETTWEADDAAEQEALQKKSEWHQKKWQAQAEKKRK